MVGSEVGFGVGVSVVGVVVCDIVSFMEGAAVSIEVGAVVDVIVGAVVSIGTEKGAEVGARVVGARVGSSGTATPYAPDVTPRHWSSRDPSAAGRQPVPWSGSKNPSSSKTPSRV